MAFYVATLAATGIFTLDTSIKAPYRLYGYHHYDPIAGGAAPSVDIVGALTSSGKIADISLIGVGGGGDEVIDTVDEHNLAVGDVIFFRLTDCVPIIDGYAVVTLVPTSTQFTIASVPLTVPGVTGEVWMGEKSVVGYSIYTEEPTFLPDETSFGLDFSYIQAILPNANSITIYYKGTGKTQ